MQRSKLLVSNHVQIYHYIMRKFDRGSAIDLVIVFLESRILVLLAPLHIAQLCLVDLVLVDQSNDFLLLAVISDHVADFIDDHHVLLLFFCYTHLLVDIDVGS